MTFKKGDKARCISGDYVYITESQEYEIIDVVGSSVFVYDNEGDKAQYCASDFELVSSPNGVDAAGSLKSFTVTDLKPLQRVVLADGREGIIGVTEQHGSVVVYPRHSFDRAQIDNEFHPEYAGMNITEVYADPGYGSMYNFSKRGELVWRRLDVQEQERAVKQKEADDALVAAAEKLKGAQAEFDAAKAARAAL